MPKDQTAKSMSPEHRQKISDALKARAATRGGNRATAHDMAPRRRGGPGGDRLNHRLVEALGSTAMAARDANISRSEARRIIDEAYRRSW